DIFLLGGVDPGLAPPLPPALGDTAVAGEPNTIYAHVWNFGKASANEVLVEFYWCNPALGINAGSVTLIAQTEMSLGAKGSGRSHAVIKCPEAWVPTFVNGGHECLLVRVWDNPADLPGLPIFDASINRHVAQRNIHVVPRPRCSVTAWAGRNRRCISRCCCRSGRCTARRRRWRWSGSHRAPCRGCSYGRGSAASFRRWLRRPAYRRSRRRRRWAAAFPPPAARPRRWSKATTSTSRSPRPTTRAVPARRRSTASAPRRTEPSSAATRS